jgi:hypothetical protein
VRSTYDPTYVLNNTTAVLLFHFVLSAARTGAKTHVTHLNFFRRARFFRQATSLGTSSFGKGPPGPGAGVGVGVGVGVAVDAGVGAGVGVGVGLGVGVRVGYMLHVTCYMLLFRFVCLRLSLLAFVFLRLPTSTSPRIVTGPWPRRICRICRICAGYARYVGFGFWFWVVVLPFPSFA